MYTRVAKPKLSLKVVSVATSSPTLKSPVAPMGLSRCPLSPLSPRAMSPTAINTARNVKLASSGFASMQQPSYSYSNSATAKSILKRHTSSRCTNSGSSTTSATAAISPTARRSKRIQFKGEPIVHPITPIDDPNYYGAVGVKLSKDERRWMRLASQS